MAAQARPKGVRVNAFNLADRYLKALGWPSTPTTRRVLAAWFMRESPRASKTDIYVIGNNPLNMTVRSGSYWMSGGGTYRIGIFPSEEAGINAFRNRISSPNWGYPRIVSAFKNHPNTASAIILAINNSGWVNGSKKHAYVYKNKKTGKYTINGLLNTYNSLGGSDLDPNEVGPYQGAGGGGGGGSTSGINIGNSTWGVDEGKIITYDDIRTIIQNMDKKGLFGSNPVAAQAAKIVVKNTLTKIALGKPWNKTTRDAVQAALRTNADEANDAGQGIGNITVDVFGALAGKTAAIAAIFVGIVLVGFGGWLVAKDVYNQSGSGMLDVTPIIVRE